MMNWVVELPLSLARLAPVDLLDLRLGDLLDPA